MITLPFLTIKTYGGLATREGTMFSGSGGGTGGPPKPPKAPVKKPKPKK